VTTLPRCRDLIRRDTFLRDTHPYHSLLLRYVVQLE